MIADSIAYNIDPARGPDRTVVGSYDPKVGGILIHECDEFRIYEGRYHDHVFHLREGLVDDCTSNNKQPARAARPHWQTLRGARW